MAGTRTVEASVVVLPKKEILDPQGKAVLGALKSLGFDEVDDCRLGKVVRLRMEVGDMNDDAVLKRVHAMAEALLANPVTEDYEVVLDDKG